MNLIRNFNIYDEGMVLDSSGYMPIEYSNKLSEENKIMGFYTIVENQIIALIRTSIDQLSVIVDGELFAMDENLLIKFKTSGDRSILKIYHQSRQIMEASYITPKPLVTPFWSEDSEDVDFGEWLFNMISSESKRKIVLDNIQIINT